MKVLFSRSYNFLGLRKEEPRSGKRKPVKESDDEEDKKVNILLLIVFRMITLLTKSLNKFKTNKCKLRMLNQMSSLQLSHNKFTQSLLPTISLYKPIKTSYLEEKQKMQKWKLKRKRKLKLYVLHFFSIIMNWDLLLVSEVS